MLERVCSAKISRLITYFAAGFKLLALLIRSYLSAIVVAAASVAKPPGWFSQTAKKETANGLFLELLSWLLRSSRPDKFLSFSLFFAFVIIIIVVVVEQSVSSLTTNPVLLSVC